MSDDENFTVHSACPCLVPMLIEDAASFCLLERPGPRCPNSSISHSRTATGKGDEGYEKYQKGKRRTKLEGGNTRNPDLIMICQVDSSESISSPETSQRNDD